MYLFKSMEDHMNKTLVILCGGDSSRMGTKKALLPFEDKTMVEYIYDKFSPFFDKIYLSVNERGDLAHLGLNAQEIPDISRNAGPFGAILSCLNPALLSNRDGYLLELTGWTQGSQAS